MQIGLIGGIGPAATDFYYRSLIEAFARQNATLDMTIVHADSPTLLNNLANNNVDAQVAIYNKLTDRLVTVGAECVVVTSIAGHFCIDAFTENSPLPVINMLQVVNQAVTARGLKRVGILGTRTVMESGFYSGISSAEVIAPAGNLLDEVHEAYVSMATVGEVTDAQRQTFDNTCEQLLGEAAVEAVMLGGTDLALVYSEQQSPFPVVDCAAIHVDAIVRHALHSP